MWSKNHKERLGKRCFSCDGGTECTFSDVSYIGQRDETIGYWFGCSNDSVGSEGEIVWIID